MDEKTFIKLWNSKATLDEIVMISGRTKGAIVSYAYRLRVAGNKVRRRRPPRSHFVTIGSIGGKKSQGGGFNDPEVARRAGSIGGRISRRSKVS